LPLVVADHVLVLVAVALSAVGFWIARELRRGYIRALEASLLDRAHVLDIQADSTLRTTMMESFAGLDLSLSSGSISLSELRSASGVEQPSAPREDAVEATPPPRSAAAFTDPEIATLISLRSGDQRRVHAELRQGRSLTPAVAAQTISLLAWDEVTGWASRALAKAAPNITGQLIDRLLDPNEDFAIRRRIPRILGTCSTARSQAGLMAALSDRRFEVRFQSGRALARIHQQAPTLALSPSDVYAAVVRETHVDKVLWHEQRLIDEPAGNESLEIDDALRLRTTRSMEHVFTLLALVLPRAPLQIAFKGLLTDDTLLRGTSLEYLESVLPRDIWNSLLPFLDDTRPAKPEARASEAVLDDLLKSNQSIELNLEEIRRKVQSE
jgi:hypothetical protein